MIKNYSIISTPTSNLLRRDVPFVWSDDCDTAFKQLKEILLSDIVLIYPDMNKPFTIQVDSSNDACGHVLFQEVNGVLTSSIQLSFIQNT